MNKLYVEIWGCIQPSHRQRFDLLETLNANWQAANDQPALADLQALDGSAGGKVEIYLRWRKSSPELTQDDQIFAVQISGVMDYKPELINAYLGKHLPHIENPTAQDAVTELLIPMAHTFSAGFVALEDWRGLASTDLQTLIAAYQSDIANWRDKA